MCMGTRIHERIKDPHVIGDSEIEKERRCVKHPALGMR